MRSIKAMEINIMLKEDLIPHLEEIKEIRHFEETVLRETNIPIVDISHWNSGNLYKNIILSQYKADALLDISDYHYSYEYNNNMKSRVLHQLLGKTINDLRCVLIHNATSAICCIADYLNKQRYKKVCLLEPSYFSTCVCLSSFGLNVYKEKITLDSNGNIEFPYDNIIRNKYDAVWITSPVFSTGIYFSKTQIEYINALIKKGIFIIVDESAASPNFALTPNMCPNENLISIFSPHKYLAINSIKFAAIICSKSALTYFEDWIDVFIGSLPLSSCVAVEHYLSPNYKLCLDKHDKYIKKNIQQIKELCVLFPDNYFNGVASNYMTMRNKAIPYRNSLKEINMLKIMRQTHVSFIPGYINSFSKDWGFCYRINLTLDTHVLKNCLGRLFSYFV